MSHATEADTRWAVARACVLVCAIASAGAPCIRPAWAHSAAHAAASAATPLTGPPLTPIRRSQGGYWDGDLGAPLVIGNRTYLLLGDILAQPTPAARVPNAIGSWVCGEDALASDSPTRTRPAPGATSGGCVAWEESASSGLAAPFAPLHAMSTVPSGAVVLPCDDARTDEDRRFRRTLATSFSAAAAHRTDDVNSDTQAAFVFMMNVSDWRNGAPGNVSANGLMLRGDAHAGAPPSLSPTPVWSAPPEAPLTNVAAVLGNGDGYVYMWTTGRYRASSVYLARTRATCAAASDLRTWQWWRGGDTPWASTWADAKPLLPSSVSTLADDVGELSAVWLPSVKRFVLCFFTYASTLSHGPWYVCSSAPVPTGPWTAPTQVMTAEPAPWWQQDWCCPYGGYLAPSIQLGARHDPTSSSDAGSRGASPRVASARDSGEPTSPGLIGARKAAPSESATVTVVVSLWMPYRSFAVALPVCC